MDSEPLLYVPTRDDWRKWLEENHATEKEIWLMSFKNHTGKPSVPYEQAVEEALCFGWIDSIVKSIDDERYARKFTPRRGRTIWSELNKKRIEKMIEQGRMTEAGLVTIATAKADSSWNAGYVQPWFDASVIPLELKEVLATSQIARENFQKLAPSYQRQYTGWIASAKRSGTRFKRAREALALLEQNQKLGLR